MRDRTQSEIALEMAEVDLETLFRTSGADRRHHSEDGSAAQRERVQDYSEPVRAG